MALARTAGVRPRYFRNLPAPRHPTGGAFVYCAAILGLRPPSQVVVSASPAPPFVPRPRAGLFFCRLRCRGNPPGNLQPFPAKTHGRTGCGRDCARCTLIADRPARERAPPWTPPGRDNYGGGQNCSEWPPKAWCMDVARLVYQPESQIDPPQSGALAKPLALARWRPKPRSCAATWSVTAACSARL